MAGVVVLKVARLEVVAGPEAEEVEEVEVVEEVVVAEEAVAEEAVAQVQNFPLTPATRLRASSLYRVLQGSTRTTLIHRKVPRTPWASTSESLRSRSSLREALQGPSSKVVSRSLPLPRRPDKPSEGSLEG